jgi:integrase
MPKRIPPLSAKKLESIRNVTKVMEVADGYVPGLRVRISPGGSRTWSLNIRDSTGERRRFEVGSGLGLSDARRKAEDLRRRIREGADPTAERRAARGRAQAARRGDGSVGALIEQYYSKGPGVDMVRAKQDKRLLHTVFADILAKPAFDLGRTEIQLIVDDWKSTSTASLAVRLLRPCLKWAEKRGYVPAGLHDLDQPGKPRKRERVLSQDELRAIWPCLAGTRGDVVKWLLLTGCRLNEVAGMKWGELDGHWWTIPADRAKNGRQRTIPLPHQAVALLKGRQRREADELAFPSSRGGVLSNWDRETKKLQEASGTSGWHRHDLRRTVATMLGDLGFPPHVVSIVLGHMHVAEGATAVYALSRYEREHGDALQALADALDRISGDEVGLRAGPAASVGRHRGLASACDDLPRSG